MADTCNDFSIVRPEDAVAEGCFVLTKQRAVIATVGQASTVEWQIRGRDGNPLDLSLCECDNSDSESNGGVKVRFSDALCPTEVWQDDATIIDATNGVVQVEVPESFRCRSSIYAMQFAVLNCDGNVVAVDTGWLSMERGLFTAAADITQGPPTLTELRLRLRDTMVENSLLDRVEFSDAEIIYSIQQPIREFNETPPPLGYNFTPATFPYHYNWTEAIVSKLLKIAVPSYMRNKLNSTAAGVALADKDKDAPYINLANMLDQQWKQWVLDKKIQLNAEQAYGSIGSAYDRW
jgi:hypothetical protein